MSYRLTWSKTFKSTDFKDPEVPALKKGPMRCTDHVNPCLRADNYPADFPTEGTWKLRTPIDVATAMPGTLQKVLSMSVSGLYITGGWGTLVQFARSDLILLGDGAEIFHYEGISHENNHWIATPLTVDQMIEGMVNLDVALWQSVDVNAGYHAHHDKDITISCEYWSESAPLRGDLQVFVTDTDTGSPVPKIKVILLSGSVIVKSGTSDSSGQISWSGIDAGSYILRVYGIDPSYLFGGYEGVDSAVVVTGGAKSTATVSVVPLPPLTVPWYAWAGIGAVAIIGGLTYFRRPLAPAVTIIREKASRFKKGYGAEEE